LKSPDRLDGYRLRSITSGIKLSEETGGKPLRLADEAQPRRGRTHMNARELSLAAVFAALYAVLVIIFAPISFGPVQLRVADALIPLAALFCWPVVSGVALGALVANTYGGLGPIDIVLGPVANFVAASLIFVLRRRRFFACLIGALPIGFIVGSYLLVFFPPPDIFGLSLSPWLAMVVSITLSSLIAIAGIGYMLLSALSRPGVAKPLASRGLKLYLPEERGAA